MALRDPYVKVNYQNKPSTATPLNRSNLDHEEEYIVYIATNAVDARDLATQVVDIVEDNNYTTTSDVNTAIATAIEGLGTLLTFGGVVATYTALTALQNVSDGTVYKVTNDSDAPTPHGANSEYYYMGNAWNYYGSDFEVALDNYYTKSETNTLLNSKVSSGTILAIKQENGLFYYTTDNSTWTVVKSGDNGATFIPSVDNDGYISWSNDKMLPNPATKNIKGQKGDTGYAPQVSVQENTQTSYKLAITYGANGESTLVTPNLKGQDGTGVGDMLMSVYDTNEDGVVNEADKVSNALTITQNGVSTTYDGSSAVSLSIGSSSVFSAWKYVYMSANGDDNNDGLSTSAPMKTLKAVLNKYSDKKLYIFKTDNTNLFLYFPLDVNDTKREYNGLAITIYNMGTSGDITIDVSSGVSFRNCFLTFMKCKFDSYSNKSAGFDCYNSTIYIKECTDTTNGEEFILYNSFCAVEDSTLNLHVNAMSSNVYMKNNTLTFRYKSNGYSQNTIVDLDELSLGYDEQNVKGSTSKEYKFFDGDGVVNLKESFTTLSKEITIAISDWVSDATYADYPYRASIAWSGITTSHKVDVNFNGANLGNAGDVASFTETYNGGFYMYASATPSASLTAQATATKVEVVTDAR